MADNPEQRIRQKILGFLLKITFSAVILYFLLSTMDPAQLVSVLSDTGRTTVLLVFLAGTGIWLMEFLRFYITIKPVMNSDKSAPLWRVFFSGYALRFLIPGGHGEVGKMIFVSGKYSLRVVAYLLDKGSLALVVSVGGLMGVWQVYPQLRSYYWFLLLIVPAVLTAVLYFSRKRVLEQSGDQRYPFVRMVLITIPLSVLHVFLMATQYWLILRGAQIPFWAIFTTVNVVLFAVMVPVSFAGLGVREWTTLQLLRSFEISKESALVAPLLIFFCNVFVPALIGTGVILIFKMKPALFSRNRHESYSNKSEAMEK